MKLKNFWRNVDVGPPDKCWNWLRSTFNHYGQLTTNSPYGRRAHRVAYILTYGEIPKGLSVRHTCDNKLCCNPKHLVLGSHKDNMRDMTERNRQAKGEKQGSSKLSSVQVLAIYFDPRPLEIIAELYHIKKCHVYKIKRKWTWKHVLEEL